MGTLPAGLPIRPSRAPGSGPGAAFPAEHPAARRAGLMSATAASLCLPQHPSPLGCSRPGALPSLLRLPYRSELPRAAQLTNVPLDGNLPEALLEAGFEGAGRALAVALGRGGHGGAERELKEFPDAPARFKRPASRWAGWPLPASPPREEAEALPPPPPLLPRSYRGGVLKWAFGKGNGEESFVQEVAVARFHSLI